MLPAYKLPHRTRRFCQFLKWFTVAAIFFYGFIVVWYSAMDLTIDHYWQRFSEKDPDIAALVQTGSTKKAALQILAFMEIIIPLTVFLAAIRLFAKFQTGEVFTQKTLSAMRILAGTILFYALSKVLMYSAFVGVFTFDNPKGHRLISIYINSSQILTLIIGIIFMIITIIFSEAVRQSDENRQIV